MVVEDVGAAEVAETDQKETAALVAADADRATAAAQSPAAEPKLPRSQLAPARIQSSRYAGAVRIPVDICP